LNESFLLGVFVICERRAFWNTNQIQEAWLTNLSSNRLAAMLRSLSICSGRRIPVAVVLLSLFFFTVLLSLSNVPPSLVPQEEKNGELVHPLALNPNCSMYNDIVGIYHDANSSSVRVVVQDNRAGSTDAPSRTPCLRPYLIGRLSGPAIGMVSPWVYSSKSNDTTVIEGRYAVPMSGLYFLEIIVILCNSYDEAKLRQAQNSTMVGLWGNDQAFQGEKQHILERCVEHPGFHRLTAQNLSIQVTHPTTEADISVRPLPAFRGYWEWNNSRRQPMKPLYTRYQDLNCTDDPNCQKPGLQRFKPYRFVWTSTLNITSILGEHSYGPPNIVPRHVVSEENLSKLIRLASQTRQNDTICVVGDSHSEDLVDALIQQIQTPVVFVETLYANEIAENLPEAGSLSDQVNKYLIHHSSSWPRDCTSVVIGLGAWVRGLG
jgi:hypothetical protein